MLCALAAIPVLIAVAVRLSSAVPPGRGPAFLDRITQNGLFVGVTAMLVSVPLFLPLTVGVVAGDTMAGEAGLGTLRYLLVAPGGPGPAAAGEIRRGRGVRRRGAAGGGAGRGRHRCGALPRGAGDPAVRGLDRGGGGLLRLLLIAAYLAVSLLGLSAIGLFMSTLTDVPVGAMAVHGGALGGLAGPRRAAAAGVAAPVAVQPLLAGLRRPAPPADRLGFLRSPMRCCRAATSPCSVRSPTAGSSPRTCSPDSGPRSMRRPAPRLRRAGVLRVPSGWPVPAGRCSARCRSASPGS